MAKDPCVLFYVQDFLNGSSLLTPLQKGHYITLLCYQQQSGSGSLKIEEIKKIMKKDFDKQWPALVEKFKKDDNGFYNERMRSEIERRKKHSQRQSENVKKRWNNHGNTVVLPLETATAIESSIRGEVFFNVEDLLTKNQIEFERICMTAKKSRPEAEKSLRKYHLWLESKEQYPKTKKALISGFEGWLMNEKKEAKVELEINNNNRYKKI